MLNFRTYFFVIVSLILTGCLAPPKPNLLESSLWENSNLKIVVVMTDLPKSNFYILNKYGILQDPLANQIAGKEFLNTVRNFDAENFSTIQNQVVNRLKRKGVNGLAYTSQDVYTLKLTRANQEPFRPNNPLDPKVPYDNSEKISYLDISRVISETGANKVLVLQLVRFGVVRGSTGPFPTGKPRGYSKIQAYLVNTSNQIEWQLSPYGFNIWESVVGKWKQKPDYPNLEKAVNKALINAEQHLINALFPGQG